MATGWGTWEQVANGASTISAPPVAQSGDCNISTDMADVCSENAETKEWESNDSDGSSRCPSDDISRLVDKAEKDTFRGAGAVLYLKHLDGEGTFNQGQLAHPEDGELQNGLAHVKRVRQKESNGSRRHSARPTPVASRTPRQHISPQPCQT